MAFRKLTPQELSSVSPAGASQQASTQPSGPTGLTGFLRGLASPFRKTLGSGFELSKGIADKIGMEMSDETRAFNPFLGQQETQNIREKPGQQSLKNLLGISSFFVPGGQGKNLLTKAVLPGAASAGLFEAGQEKATGGSIARAGGIGGVTGGALGLLGKGFEKARGLFGKSKQAVQKRAINSLIDAAPAQADDFISRRGTTLDDALRNVVRKSGRGATQLDDLVGSVAQKGRGGIFDDVITQAEQQIQNTVKTKGKGVLVHGEDIINKLLERRKQLGSSVVNRDKVAQLNKLIELVEFKYSKGANVNSALATIRQANSTWGKAQTITGKEAIKKQVGIEEADVLRETLKRMFPEIADALDTQADALALQPILSRARAKGTNVKFNLGAFDVTRPGVVADKILRQPGVVSRVGGIAGAPTPTQAGLPLPQPQGRMRELLGQAGQQAGGVLPPIGAGQFFKGGQPDAVPEAPVTSKLLQAGVSTKDKTGLSKVFTPEVLTAALVSGELTASDIGALEKRGIIEQLPSAAERKVKSDFDASVKGLETLKVQVGKIKNVGDIATYNTQKALVGQQVARLFEAGRLSDEDRKFYQKRIPSVASIMLAPELSKKLIDAITSLIEQRASTVEMPQQNTGLEGLLGQ